MPGSTKVAMSGFVDGLRGAGAAQLNAAQHALSLYAQQVIGDAQEKCPRDTGRLSDSGVAEPAERTGERMRVVLGFNTDYAAAVHENLDADFNKDKNALAQPKYLESSLRQNAEKMGAFVAAKVAAASAGGGAGA